MGVIIVELGNAQPHMLVDPEPIDEGTGEGSLREIAQKRGVLESDFESPLTEEAHAMLLARLNAAKVPQALDVTDAVTGYQLDDSLSLSQLATEVKGAWHTHSDAPPSWVRCEDDLLARLIASDMGITGTPPEV